MEMEDKLGKLMVMEWWDSHHKEDRLEGMVEVGRWLAVVVVQLLDKIED